MTHPVTLKENINTSSVKYEIINTTVFGMYTTLSEINIQVISNFFFLFSCRQTSTEKNNQCNS